MASLRPRLSQCARMARAPCPAATRLYATERPSALGRPAPASAEVEEGTPDKGKVPNSSLVPFIAAGLGIGVFFTYLLSKPRAAHETAKSVPDKAVSQSRIGAGDDHQKLKNDRKNIHAD